MSRRAFLLAHYDAHGRLRPDLVRLLAAACRMFDVRVLVSTGLDAAAAQATLGSQIRVIVRENVGYDFHSYRAGLLDLLADDSLDEIVMMNDSLHVHDAHLFASRCLAPSYGQAEVLSLTRSFEVQPHCQSFFFCLRRRVFRRPGFRDWWEQLPILREKSGVILEQELGFSQFLHVNAYLVDHHFKPDRYSHFCWLDGEPSFPRLLDEPSFEVILRVNPSHFFCMEILKQFGVIKNEVLRDNPYRFNLEREIAGLPRPADLLATLGALRAGPAAGSG